MLTITIEIHQLLTNLQSKIFSHFILNKNDLNILICKVPKKKKKREKTIT